MDFFWHEPGPSLKFFHQLLKFWPAKCTDWKYVKMEVQIEFTKAPMNLGFQILPKHTTGDRKLFEKNQNFSLFF